MDPKKNIAVGCSTHNSDLNPTRIVFAEVLLNEEHPACAFAEFIQAIISDPHESLSSSFERATEKQVRIMGKSLSTMVKFGEGNSDGI